MVGVIGIAEKLKDFCFVLSNLLAQDCVKSSFGSVNAQTFTFGS